MATLLGIARDAMGEVGVPLPSSIAGSTDPRAVSLLALAKRELYTLSTRKWWPCLIYSTTFNTVVGQEQYDLPVDFGALVPATHYINSRPEELRGSLGPHDWSRDKAYGSIFSIPGFRIFGATKKVSIVPVPTAVETYGYEYRTKYFATAAGTGSGKETFTSDDDTPVVPGDLIKLGIVWRYKRSRGFDYAEDFREYQEMVEQQYAQMLGSGILTVGKPDHIQTMTDGYVRDRDFGA